MKVALYARVSTRDGGHDPEVQLIKLRTFSARQGWEVHDEYVDFATGRNNNRPGLDRLLKDAREGEFDSVIIVRIDRITRSLANLYQLLQDLQRWVVCMVATDQDLDTNTTNGKFMLNIFGSLAHGRRS